MVLTLALKERQEKQEEMQQQAKSGNAGSGQVMNSRSMPGGGSIGQSDPITYVNEGAK
jgi:hypothetical protein